MNHLKIYTKTIIPYSTFAQLLEQFDMYKDVLDDKNPDTERKNIYLALALEIEKRSEIITNLCNN